MSIAELLLKFSGKSLLDFVEVLQKWDWDEDHNCTLAMADFEL